jgi:antitoxin YefM
MSITASKARKEFFRLIKEVHEDHDAIEIVSKHGNAVLVSAEDYATLREGAYLLRSQPMPAGCSTPTRMP